MGFRIPGFRRSPGSDSFSLGGWVHDPQFMDQMDSPFVLAHGRGVPVEEASTTVEFPAVGTYRV